MQRIKQYLSLYFEPAVWATGLFLLALMDPAAEGHYSLCFFKWTGLSFCPGCGLGHSISWLFHGEFVKSFNEHPLGIFAVAILLHRIFTIIKKRTLFLTA